MRSVQGTYKLSGHPHEARVRLAIRCLTDARVDWSWKRVNALGKLIGWEPYEVLIALGREASRNYVEQKYGKTLGKGFVSHYDWVSDGEEGVRVAL